MAIDVDKIKEEGIKEALVKKLSSEFWTIRTNAEDSTRDYPKRVVKNLNIIKDAIKNIEIIMKELGINQVPHRKG